jgi:hypothetical protein
MPMAAPGSKSQIVVLDRSLECQRRSEGDVLKRPVTCPALS